MIELKRNNSAGIFVLCRYYCIAYRQFSYQYVQVVEAREGEILARIHVTIKDVGTF